MQIRLAEGHNQMLKIKLSPLECTRQWISVNPKQPRASRPSSKTSGKMRGVGPVSRAAARKRGPSDMAWSRTASETTMTKNSWTPGSGFSWGSSRTPRFNLVALSRRWKERTSSTSTYYIGASRSEVYSAWSNPFGAISGTSESAWYSTPLETSCPCLI